MSTRVYFGRLPSDTRESDIEKLIKKYGRFVFYNRAVRSALAKASLAFFSKRATIDMPVAQARMQKMWQPLLLVLVY